MNWYKYAKLLDKDPEEHKTIFVQCMLCKNYQTEDGTWKEVSDFDEEEKQQLESIPDEWMKTIKSPMGISHGICPKCMEEHYPSIAKQDG